MKKIGKIEGKGIYIYKNGDNYDGEWKEDKKKVKEHILFKMVINMMENGKIKKRKKRHIYL